MPAGMKIGLPKIRARLAYSAGTNNFNQQNMSAKPNFQAEGYNTVTPYLIVNGAAAALDFYKSAFNAQEVMRMPGPGGKIMHAEIQIGDSRVMLGDECPEMGALAPQGNSWPVTLMIYVKDVDALTAQAIKAGAKVHRPVQDQFYGDRSGAVIDPFGHSWMLATHIEDVSPEEMGKRMAAMKKP